MRTKSKHRNKHLVIRQKVSSYDPDFKKAVVQYAEQKSTKEAKRLYGISESNIRRWRRLKNDIYERSESTAPIATPSTSTNNSNNNSSSKKKITLRRQKNSKNNYEIAGFADPLDCNENSDSIDSMPLNQRLSADEGQSSSQPVLQSQPLSPTKLKVTRQSIKQVAQSPVSPPKQPDPPKEPPNEEVCLRWNSHHSNMQAVFPNLLMKEQYVDVTMVAEGHSLKCHRMILSSCSPYFESILEGISPFQHPVLFMNNIPFWVLKSLCDYMYAGEVHIFQNKLEELLAVAETLRIKGLAGKAATESKTEPVEPSKPTEKVKEEKKFFEKKPSEKKTSEKKSSDKKTASSELGGFPVSSKFRDNDDDALLDPLDLLQPLYEVEEKHKIPTSVQKPKDIKNASVKKSIQKKVKKRKFLDRDPISRLTRRTHQQIKTIHIPKPTLRVTETNTDNENKKSAAKKPSYKRTTFIKNLITYPISPKFDSRDIEDNLLDPLELLEPLYEVEEKQPRKTTVTQKLREIKSIPSSKKDTHKKVKKRKLEVEVSPPPVFHFRKGTRSRPNVKIPKYYHSSYDDKSPRSSPVELLEQLPLQNIPVEIQEPSSSTAAATVPHPDPLLGTLEIKPEPLEVDDHDVIIYSDNDTLMQEDESIIGNFDSPIVNQGLDIDQDVEVVEHSLDDGNLADDSSINIGETSSRTNEESTDFPRIKLIAPIITEVRSIVESSPKRAEENKKPGLLEGSEPMEMQIAEVDPGQECGEKVSITTLLEGETTLEEEQSVEEISRQESQITQSENISSINEELTSKGLDNNMEIGENGNDNQIAGVESSSNLTEIGDVDMPILEPVVSYEDNVNSQYDAPNIVGVDEENNRSAETEDESQLQEEISQSFDTAEDEPRGQEEISKSSITDFGSQLREEISNSSETDYGSQLREEMSKSSETDQGSLLREDTNKSSETDFGSQLREEMSKSSETDYVSQSREEISKSSETDYGSQLREEMSNSSETDNGSQLREDMSKSSEVDYGSQLQEEMSKSSGTDNVSQTQEDMSKSSETDYGSQLQEEMSKSSVTDYGSQLREDMSKSSGTDYGSQLQEEMSKSSETGYGSQLQEEHYNFSETKEESQLQLVEDEKHASEDIVYTVPQSGMPHLEGISENLPDEGESAKSSCTFVEGDKASENIEKELTELLAEPSIVVQNKLSEFDDEDDDSARTDDFKMDQSQESEITENVRSAVSKEIDVINEIEKTIQLLNAIGGSNEQKLNEIASSSSGNIHKSEDSVALTVQEEDSSITNQRDDAASSSDTFDGV